MIRIQPLILLTLLKKGDTLKFTEKNFYRLLSKTEKQQEEIDNLKRLTADLLKLFDYDKGGYLSVEDMRKVMGKDYLIYETRFMNVVRGWN